MIAFAPDLARIEQHDAPTNRGKNVDHFKIVKGGIARNSFFKQYLQLWNIPLAVAEVVNKPVFDFAG
jgi:hypothetical protein